MANDSSEEEFYDFLDQEQREKLYKPETRTGRTPSPWSDELLVERVKKISLPNLKDFTTRRVLTHKILQFFLTGKTTYVSAPVLFQHFIVSFEWFDALESGTLPIYESLIEAGATIDPALTVGEAHSLDTLLQEFAQRLSVEPVYKMGKRKRTRGRVREKVPGNDALYQLALGEKGLTNLSKEQLMQKVKEYYQYVDNYFDPESRQRKCFKFVESTPFVRSLHLLALICFRSRAKHPESVENYIITGRYNTLMNKFRILGPCCLGSYYPLEKYEIYRVSPVTREFKELSREFYISKSTTTIETAACLIYFYCKEKYGLQKTYTSNGTKVVRAEAHGSLNDDQRLFLRVLEGGCMSRLHYKGLSLLLYYTELHRTSNFDPWYKIIPCINTTVTANALTQLLTQFVEYRRTTCVPRPDGKYELTTPQSTWMYARCIDETALINLANASNAQLIWRLSSLTSQEMRILKPEKLSDISRLKIQPCKERSIQKYIPTDSDLKYVKEASKRLRGVSLKLLKQALEGFPLTSPVCENNH